MSRKKGVCREAGRLRERQDRVCDGHAGFEERTDFSPVGCEPHLGPFHPGRQKEDFLPADAGIGEEVRTVRRDQDLPPLGLLHPVNHGREPPDDGGIERELRFLEQEERLSLQQ